MKINIDKCIEIFKQNNLYRAFSKYETFDEDYVFGLYFYLKLQIIFRNQIKQFNSFSKIPNVKLLRLCTSRKIYKPTKKNPNTPCRISISLRSSKEAVEAFLDLGFIFEKEKEHEFEKTFPNFSYHISEIGELLVEELEKYIIYEHEICLIKTLLLVPDIIDSVEYRSNFSEKFIKTYLDFVHYGGIHV